MNNPSQTKIYCVNFVAENVNLGALQQYLFDSADIIAYWNYIPLVYCIKSRLSSVELAIKLRPFLPQNYMIAEINPHNLNGILPPAAWEWFYLNHHEKNRPPAPSSSGLGLASALGVAPSQGLLPSPLFPKR
jgi:hypothetical protein